MGRRPCRRLATIRGGINLRLMSKYSLVVKAIAGVPLTEAERSALPSSLLAQLAAGGYVELTPADRRHFSKTTLAQLAAGGFIKLVRHERDRLDSYAIALLAVAGRVELEKAERARLPRRLRAVVDTALQRSANGAR